MPSCQLPSGSAGSLQLPRVMAIGLAASRGALGAREDADGGLGQEVHAVVAGRVPV